MKNNTKKFLGKYITGYTISVFIGIIATLCVIYWGESFFSKGKELFYKDNFKFYLILSLAVIWLFFYVVYLHRQFVNFVKFVLDKQIMTDKDIQTLNRNTRNLIIQHKEFNKEDGVA